MPKPDFVGRPVLRERGRMVDRNVREALLEIAFRVAASVHDSPNQRFGVANCRRRIVYERPLRALPFVAEAGAFVGRDRPDGHLGDSLLAGSELLLRTSGVAFLGQRPVIFGAEPLSELLAPLLAAAPLPARVHP